MASTSRALESNEIEQLLEEYEGETSSSSDEDGSETAENEHISEHSDEDDLFDVESGSDDDDVLLSDFCMGKNGYTWRRTPFTVPNTRTASRNIVINQPGPKGIARDAKTELEAWKLFFPDEILDIIVMHTNAQIDRISETIKNQRYTSKTDKVELMALFGLMYRSGLYKTAKTNLSELWSIVDGPPIFRATMSKNRFEFLVNYLRFDDHETREARKVNDNFAALREVWDKFQVLCSEYYTPSEHVTVDEQILGFRGRCKFIVYMPQKPDKYGMKVVMMCDAKTAYMISAIPYVGRMTECPTGQSIPSYYVLKLSEPIHHTNRNITMDNWFSSIQLANELRNIGLTMIGTLRKNKPEIPPKFLSMKKDFPTSVFAFDKNITLVSHVPKKNKCVVLISTMHNSGEIDPNTQKPAIILDYNATKGGVDTFDQLSHSKTTARKTRRWPLRFFYGMLDAGGINSYVILKANFRRSKLKRNYFLRNLSLQLVQPYVKRRLDEVKNLPQSLKVIMLHVLGVDEENSAQVTQARPTSSSRCYLCTRAKDRKGREKCVKCSKNICAQHRLPICHQCI